jgi:hypothetical protein
MVELGITLFPNSSIEEIRKKATEAHPDIRSFKNLLGCLADNFKDPNMDIHDNISYFFENSFRENLRQTSLFTSHIVQENYISMAPKNAKLEDIWKMSDFCSIGDLVKESAFQHQAWDYMNDIGNALGTLGPIHILKETKGKVVAKVPNRKMVSIPEYVSELRMSLVDVTYVMMKLVGNPETVEENIPDFFEFTKNMDFDNSLKILHMAYSFNNIPYKDVKRITSKLKKYYDANFT